MTPGQVCKIMTSNLLGIVFILKVHIDWKLPLQYCDVFPSETEHWLHLKIIEFRCVLLLSYLRMLSEESAFFCFRMLTLNEKKTDQQGLILAHFLTVFLRPLKGRFQKKMNNWIPGPFHKYLFIYMRTANSNKEYIWISLNPE